MNEQNDSDIIVSFDGVKIKDFRAYWSAVARGDWAGQDKFFALVVKEWPYDLDPTDPESYGELELEAYTAVQAAIKGVSGQTGLALVKPALNRVKSK